MVEMRLAQSQTVNIKKLQTGKHPPCINCGIFCNDCMSGGCNAESLAITFCSMSFSSTCSGTSHKVSSDIVMANDLGILFLFTCPCCNPPLKNVWWCLYVISCLLSYRRFKAVLTHLGQQETRYWDLLRLEHGMRPSALLPFQQSVGPPEARIWRTNEVWLSLRAYLQLPFLFSWQNWHFTAYLWADQPVPDSQVVLIHDRVPPVNGTESEEMW